MFERETVRTHDVPGPRLDGLTQRDSLLHPGCISGRAAGRVDAVLQPWMRPPRAIVQKVPRRKRVEPGELSAREAGTRRSPRRMRRSARRGGRDSGSLASQKPEAENGELQQIRGFEGWGGSSENTAQNCPRDQDRGRLTSPLAAVARGAAGRSLWLRDATPVRAGSPQEPWQGLRGVGPRALLVPTWTPHPEGL